MVRPSAGVALLVLVLSSCGSQASKTATSSVVARQDSSTTQYVEGSFAPAGGSVVRLNESPLLGATKFGSFGELSKAAEAAAIANGVHVSIVDPTAVVGASATFYFNGLSGAAVGNNITVEMALGAWSDTYAEHVVTAINSNNPGVVAIRLKDAPLDCIKVIAKDIDTLECGIGGTDVSILVPHDSKNAEATSPDMSPIATIGRAFLGNVTVLNPSGKDHP